MLKVRSRVACQASELVGFLGSEGLALACLAYTSGTMTQEFWISDLWITSYTVSGAWFSLLLPEERL